MKKFIITSGVIFLAFASIAGAQEYSFSQDLTVGASGDDVVALQTWLMANGFDIPSVQSGAAAKGYFGNQTREALRRFQESEGLPTTGYFGRLSRGRIHDRGSHNTSDKRTPVINGVDAPTVLSVNETGTWNIRATDPQNGTLSYSVDWGDMVNYPAVPCPAGYTCVANSGVVPLPTIQQGSSFTHAYSDARTYKVTFTVRNNLGLSTRSTATVKVTNSNASPLNIISPNGGEVWTKGTTQTIKWNSPAYFRATYADLKIVRYTPPCLVSSPCPLAPAEIPRIIATNISINLNSFSWKVGDYIPEVMTMIYPPVYPTVGDGQYVIQVCETGTNNCDSSDRPFTIKSNSIPQVTSPNSGEVWVANSAQYLRWNIPAGMDTMTRVDLYLDQKIECNVAIPAGAMTQCPPISTYILDKNIPITMVYNWLVATDINNAKIPDGTYTFRVCLAGSTTNCDSSDQSFKIVTELLKVCPSSKVINQMPTPVGPNQNPSSVYYILNGQRKELTEFDSNWVQYNCAVPQQVVY